MESNTSKKFDVTPPITSPSITNPKKMSERQDYLMNKLSTYLTKLTQDKPDGQDIVFNLSKICEEFNKDENIPDKAKTAVSAQEIFDTTKIAISNQNDELVKNIQKITEFSLVTNPPIRASISTIGLALEDAGYDDYSLNNVTKISESRNITTSTLSTEYTPNIKSYSLKNPSLNTLKFDNQSAFDSLETLDLSDTKIGDSSITNLCEQINGDKMPALNSLSIEGCKNITAKGLEDLSKSKLNLKEFKVEIQDADSLKHVSAIIQNCTSLENLCINIPPELQQKEEYKELLGKLNERKTLTSFTINKEIHQGEKLDQVLSGTTIQDPSPAAKHPTDPPVINQELYKTVGNKIDTDKEINYSALSKEHPDLDPANMLQILQNHDTTQITKISFANFSQNKNFSTRNINGIRDKIDDLNDQNKLSNVEELDFSNSGITNADVLVTMASNMPHLKTLNLRQNGILKDNFDFDSPERSDLQTLDLGQTGIGDTSFKSLITHIKNDRLPELTTLKLDGCNFSKDSFKDFKDAAESKNKEGEPKLQKLEELAIDSKDQESMGDLAEALTSKNCPNLKKVTLCIPEKERQGEDYKKLLTSLKALPLESLTINKDHVEGRKTIIEWLDKEIAHATREESGPGEGEGGGGGGGEGGEPKPETKPEEEPGMEPGVEGGDNGDGEKAEEDPVAKSEKESIPIDKLPEDAVEPEVDPRKAPDKEKVFCMASLVQFCVKNQDTLFKIPGDTLEGNLDKKTDKAIQGLVGDFCKDVLNVKKDNMTKKENNLAKDIQGLISTPEFQQWATEGVKTIRQLFPEPGKAIKGVKDINLDEASKKLSSGWDEQKLGNKIDDSVLVIDRTQKGNSKGEKVEKFTVVGHHYTNTPSSDVNGEENTRNIYTLLRNPAPKNEQDPKLALVYNGNVIKSNGCFEKSDDPDQKDFTAVFRNTMGEKKQKVYLVTYFDKDGSVISGYSSTKDIDSKDFVKIYDSKEPDKKLDQKVLKESELFKNAGLTKDDLKLIQITANNVNESYKNNNPEKIKERENIKSFLATSNNEVDPDKPLTQPTAQLDGRIQNELKEVSKFDQIENTLTSKLMENRNKTSGVGMGGLS